MGNTLEFRNITKYFPGVKALDNVSFIAHSGEWFTCLFGVVLFVLCVIRHRSNIGRLINGTENKIGQKVKPNQTTEK